MGATRLATTDDKEYTRRRAYYLAHKDEVLARAKIRYQEDKPTIRKIMKAYRDAAKTERLLEKRRKHAANYGLKIPTDNIAQAKEYVRGLKATTPCTDCGQTYPHYVMDFDHVTGTKTQDVSRLMGRGRPIRILEQEIAKCELVCANCHRKRTFTRDQPLG